MADAVSSKTISNTPYRLVMSFSNLSDATGESAVVKVDKSTFTGPNGLEPSSLRIDRIVGNTSGMVVTIKVNHTSAITVAQVNGDFDLDFSKQGGFQTSGAGGTGDIEFTTVGHSSGDTYNIVLYMKKKD